MIRPASGQARGFTLLEVLVVVALIALTSAILVPALLRVNTSTPVDAADQLTNVLTELSERSLFLGQITALRVDDHAYTPLYYDINKERFLPFDEDALTAVTLPTDVSLSWQPEDGTNLSQTIQTGMAQAANQSDQDAASAPVNVTTSDAPPAPQIYFLPGGQTTSGQLTLVREEGKPIVLSLDPLGQVTQLTAKDEGQDAQKLPPLLLPDDASFYQSIGSGQGGS